MQRVDSLEKTLMLGKDLKTGGEGDDRGWDGWMASPTQWTWVWASSGDGKGQGSLECCKPWGRKESDTTEWLNNNNNKNKLRTCLVVQELGIHLLVQGTWVWSLDPENFTCGRATKPVGHSSWSPLALEPALCNKKSHHNEKPVRHNQRKPSRSNKDPAQPKIKNKI